MTQGQKSPRKAQGAKVAWVVLFIIAVVNVISCAGGSWGIFANGADLFGGDILAGTVFDEKYWLAAVALAFVGAVQLVAVVMQLRHSRWAASLHAFAGMTMMVFIFVEVLSINETFILQPIFFGLGALQLSLSPLFAQMWSQRPTSANSHID